MTPVENQADLPTRPSPSGSVTAEDALQAQVHSLRKLFSCTLVALIILSFGVNVFIWRQMSLTRQQLDENSRMVAEYRRVTEPRIRDLLGRLEVFAAANRDFQPILAKYIPPRPQPAPATPAKPAK
jgi:hypothetical protein